MRSRFAARGAAKTVGGHATIEPSYPEALFLVDPKHHGVKESGPEVVENFWGKPKQTRGNSHRSRLATNSVPKRSESTLIEAYFAGEFERAVLLSKIAVLERQLHAERVLRSSLEQRVSEQGQESTQYDDVNLDVILAPKRTFSVRPNLLASKRGLPIVASEDFSE